MSCSADRLNGIEFIHVAEDFKMGEALWDHAASAIGYSVMMGRRRNSSVPLGAVIVALVIIAVLALLAFYVGDGAVLTRFADPPFVGPEEGNH